MPSVEVVADQNQMGNVLMHYADRCRDELLSVAPGRLPKTRIDSRTRIANLYSARAPSWLIDHGASNSANTARIPSVKTVHPHCTADMPPV